VHMKYGANINNYYSHFGWFFLLFKNQWECLLRWWNKLWLVTKGDGIEIHGFYSGNFILLCHNILYYYIKL
jgi:hypothetical protein